MGKTFVYRFDQGHKDMRDLLGGKGANLAEMTAIGLPVPQGFTITTEACNDYYEKDGQVSSLVLDQIDQALLELEKVQGKVLGSDDNPLLVSVRSGAVFSMPGMMDTILNLGLNDKSVLGLASSTQNERFAYDSYRRFIQMFSDVAMEIPKYKFEAVLDRIKEAKGYQSDTDLTTDDLMAIVAEYKTIYQSEMGKAFPQNPKEQLLLAIKAVFRSWNNPRARIYRQLNDISDQLGTAVNIQSMVFGNMGADSGTGVAFTRNPATGEAVLFGEYLINAQEKMWWQAFGHLKALPLWKKRCQLFIINLLLSLSFWKSTIVICRMWNSLSRRVSFICYRPVMGNVLPRPLSRLPLIW